MRRNRTITVILVLLCLLATLAGGIVLRRHYWPTAGPSNALFEKYKDNSHVKACHLRDFQVNDTLAVETVLLQATTDSAWCALMVDFGAPAEFMELYMTDKSLFIGDDINAITLIYVDKDDVRKHLPQADPNSRLVLVSHAKKTICVFIIEDKNTKEQIYSEETQKLKL